MQTREPYRDDKHSTSTVLRSFPLASAAAPAAVQSAQETSDLQMPGPVIKNILDYALSTTISDEKAQPAALSTHNLPLWGEMKLVKTIYNQVEQQRLKDVNIAILSGAKPDDVIRRIEQDPRILLATADEKQCMTMRGLSGHCAAPTVYRTALATYDTQMAKRIKDELIKVAGAEEAKAQYNAQFPEGWKQAEEKRWQPIFAQMERVTQAIRHATPSDITSSGAPDYRARVTEGSGVAKELAYFNLLLDATLHEAAMTGRHLYPRLIQQALQTDHKHFHDYFGSDKKDPRALLYWQQLLGIEGIQRYLPVNYIQAFGGGLKKTADNLRVGRPQERSLKIEILDSARGYWVSTDIYPLSASRGISGLGIYGVAGWRRCAGPMREDWPDINYAQSFSKLMSIKDSKHADLYSNPDPRRTASRFSCAVM